MLRQRIITAIVLLAILLPALFAGAWPFALVTLLFVAAAAWEWARLNGFPGPGAVVLGVLVALLGIAALVTGWAQASIGRAWWAVVMLWLAGGGSALRAGTTGWAEAPRELRLAAGVFLLWTGWLALNLARAQGLGFVLSIFALVWAADVAAYFGGRSFGRRKLAPRISPGKSWEGAWCGVGAAAMVAVAWLVVDHRVRDVGNSLFESLFSGFGGFGMVVAVVALAAISVVGDLCESLAKRAAGAKDSSNLLPGHGGVLDRIDALLPVFPTALALHSLT